MRYPKEHKEVTRTRIVRTAARRFRSRGSERTAIGTVMRELRLTHGGFYRHFPTKQALFGEAVALAFDEVGEVISRAVDAAPPGGALAAVVQTYLSSAHCEHPETGCPMAALGADLARLPKPARVSVQRELVRYADRMASYMPGVTPDERARRALVLFASMAGTLATARAMTDPVLREQTLADARRFFSSAWSEA